MKEKILSSDVFVIQESQGLYINLTLKSKIVTEMTSRDIYKLLKIEHFIIPTAIEKWNEKGFLISQEDWRVFYRMPYLITRDTKVQSFQYKILHQFFPCNYWLSKWNIDIEENCDMCGHCDTIEHYFIFCCISKTFWTSVFNWFSAITSVSVRLTVEQMLLGIEIIDDDSILFSLNYVILLGKFFIAKCKKNQSRPMLYEFLKEIRYKLEIEKYIAMANDKVVSFDKRWGLLYGSL